MTAGSARRALKLLGLMPRRCSAGGYGPLPLNGCLYPATNDLQRRSMPRFTVFGSFRQLSWKRLMVSFPGQLDLDGYVTHCALYSSSVTGIDMR
jgi:hypothetical protein